MLTQHITPEAISQRRRELMTGPSATWLTLPDDDSTWTLIDVIACYPEAVRTPILLKGHHLYRSLVEYSEGLKRRHRQVAYHTAPFAALPSRWGRVPA